MTDYDALLGDLVAEEDDLDALVAPLDERGWRLPTPAVGWDVRDSVAHLAVAEELAALALTDADRFAAALAELLADPVAAEEALAGRGRASSGADVLAWWREERATTVAELRRRDPRDRVPWIAGPMSAMSFTTARLMETWAHGVDVADALGVVSAPTARLRHVADLGVRTRPFAFRSRGLAVPPGDVRVELTAPDGSTWTWGESHDDVVRGPALDFCLVVTQRRHPDDTALEVEGAGARDWIGIAQAFAGPPTPHRPPRAA